MALAIIAVTLLVMAGVAIWADRTLPSAKYLPTGLWGYGRVGLRRGYVLVLPLVHFGVMIALLRLCLKSFGLQLTPKGNDWLAGVVICAAVSLFFQQVQWFAARWTLRRRGYPSAGEADPNA